MQVLHLTSYLTSELFAQDIQERNIPFEKIIILDKMPLSTIVSQMLQPWFDKMVINLYAGMWSIGRKISSEWEDLALVPSHIMQYEPLDLKNLLDILQEWWPAYIRIPHQYFSENIFSLTDEIGFVDSQMLGKIDFLSLKGYWYTGDEGTVLASWANFSTLLQLGDILNQAGGWRDLFVMSRLNGERHSDFLSSIHKTKKLAVIMDYQPSDARKTAFYQKILRAGGCEFQLERIAPQYKLLTTIFDEFYREQTEFDAQGIFSRLWK